MPRRKTQSAPPAAAAPAPTPAPAPAATPAAPATNGDTTAAAAPKLRPVTVELLDQLRVPFLGYIQASTVWLKSKADIAPLFHKALAAWKHDTELGMADFVRLFDTTLPQLRDDYKNHPSYVAATYLMGLATGRRRRRPTGPVPLNPRDAMVRLVKAVLPLITPEQVDSLWKALSSQLHWSEMQMRTLHKDVESKETTPLVYLKPADPEHVPQLLISAPRAVHHAAKKRTTRHAAPAKEAVAS